MALTGSYSVGNRRRSFQALRKLFSALGTKNDEPRGQFFTLFVFVVSLTFAAAQEVDVSRIIPSGYNLQMKPGSPMDDNTLNVTISVYVNDLMGVVDKDQTFQVDIILVQEWTDNRLNVSEIEQNFVVTQPSIIKQFWLPEIYFVNGLSATVVNAFQSVQKLTITREALVNYAQRINAMLSCPMNLQNFPHDYQYCRIKMSTLIYNKTEVRLVWKQFEAYPGEYPIFKIRYWYTADCENWENPIPENSCISGTLKLVRRLSYYIIRYYLLTFLTVAISFVGLWVPINAWPARITLLVMPLLNLITQDIAINNEIGVYYVVSFHWWMMWLQGFIYLEIVEYAVAIAWAHFIADKKHFAKMLEQANNNASQTGTSPVTTPVPPYLEGYYFGNHNWYTKCGVFFDKFVYFFFGNVDLQLDPYTRNKVDYVCRVIMVFIFLFFVFLYIMITVIYWAANYN